MAEGKKVTITKIYLNNSPTATVVSETVDTEVVQGQVVARQEIVNPGVINR